MRRIVLFVLTNLAVIALLSIIVKLFGIDTYTYRNGGINYQGLLIMSAIVGFSGSLISLAISKWVAKWQTRAHVITQPSNQTEAWLVETVRRQAEKSGIRMPEVAIYDAPEMNAFATGPTRNNALVAVSTGLLQQMSKDEVEAVLAHEVSHVANGDMVTMTLIQGVVNTFVIFLARVVGTVIDRAISGNREGGNGIAYFAIVLVLQFVLGIFASMIVMAFSRWREFRADAGSARIVGKEKMIAALSRLNADRGENTLPQAIQAFGIAGGGMRKLFSSHPPIEERIAALRKAG
ncbi:MAG TPA: protease HtpX [Dokdonella sp.]|uniref:protease HtpX n=1 Tax=Dokdonella sp. TaxID=2291710 RepID=UPI0025BBB357|nr:protease HtpX [Dokdonella sp.]MBX3692157.1 protease HtpX [Dokdonella sp.]MCW5567305.1 protease HtpX [Dokdonella sp.]HNR91819.1 protease HtpX [Dokdonella sp.]